MVRRKGPYHRSCRVCNLSIGPFATLADLKKRWRNGRDGIWFREHGHYFCSLCWSWYKAYGCDSHGQPNYHKLQYIDPDIARKIHDTCVTAFWFWNKSHQEIAQLPSYSFEGSRLYERSHDVLSRLEDTIRDDLFAIARQVYNDRDNLEGIYSEYIHFYPTSAFHELFREVHDIASDGFIKWIDPLRCMRNKYKEKGLIAPGQCPKEYCFDCAYQIKL